MKETGEKDKKRKKEEKEKREMIGRKKNRLVKNNQSAIRKMKRRQRQE